MIAARLEDVAPDGSSTLVTYGLLNLTHRDGHEHPQPLVPGRKYRVEIALNDIAQAFPAGHRIRLALATSHWPIAWPSPEMATLLVSTGNSTLSLPVRAALARSTRRLRLSRRRKRRQAEPHVVTKLAGRNRTITEDPMTGEVTVTVHRERASYHSAGDRPGLRSRRRGALPHPRGRPCRHDRRHARHMAAFARRLAHPHGDPDARRLHGDDLRDRSLAGSLRGRDTRGQPHLEAQHPALAFVMAVRMRRRNVIGPLQK